MSLLSLSTLLKTAFLGGPKTIFATLVSACLTSLGGMASLSAGVGQLLSSGLCVALARHEKQCQHRPAVKLGLWEGVIYIWASLTVLPGTRLLTPSGCFLVWPPDHLSTPRGTRTVVIAKCDWCSPAQKCAWHLLAVLWEHVPKQLPSCEMCEELTHIELRFQRKETCAGLSNPAYF